MVGGSGSPRPGHSVGESGTVAEELALQVSSEECPGHLKETSLSGIKVTWLALETGFKVTVKP